MQALEVSSRLKTIANEYYGGNAAAMGRDLDETQPSISRALKGQTIKSVARVLDKLVRRGYSEIWLRTGKGDMRTPQYVSSEYSGVGETPTDYSSIETTPSTIGGVKIGKGQLRTIIINPEEEVQLLPTWAMPILMAASHIIFDKLDVDRATMAEKEGRPFRWRLFYEDADPHEEKPKEPPPTEE